MSISTIAGEETEQHSLTNKDILGLISKGKLNTGKIVLHHPSDMQRIESTGVVVQTQEPNYVVIRGDLQRFEKLRSMGLSIVKPLEADHKLRMFRVSIQNWDEFQRLKAIVTDLWPLVPGSSSNKLPVIAIGRAYDNEFKWAKEAGLNIERCPSENCH